MTRKIVIVGGGAAGSSAASFARKTDRKAEITLIDMHKDIGYSRCGLPFVIGKEIPSYNDLTVYSESYFKMSKIDTFLETTVTQIEPKGKYIMAIDKNGTESTIEYDSLILATGADVFCPPIPGIDTEGVLPLRTIEDGIEIEERAKTSKSVVIIGAGLIGLEIAVALRERGLEVTIVEMLPYILPLVLDKDMAKDVHKELTDLGIEIITGCGVDEILGDEEINACVIGEETIDTDFAINATGVRADVKLAKAAGISVGKGIQVNKHMETSIPDIYAIGDCVECKHLITGEYILSQLGTTATRQGLVAGRNAAGQRDIFPGVLMSSVTKIHGLEIGATGLTKWAADRANIETVIGKMTGHTKPHYFPGGSKVKVKILARKDDSRVIGAQIVAREDVGHRVNMVATAIQSNMTVNELAKVDTCYAPPIADTLETVCLAAELAAKKL
ncbi:FAD-dependent oxidoreductase [Candidatus Borrarchaeum sp.]|uniref:FAD-dependent oxidoreductase n=1 Tax=Candidatus Borrarchaeum sp. TaxID=2846742 RepID=UPI00257F7A3D|nr:FAD-dependent oxidoreductase [Candidatus Borrarchaeum sp.]